jgi:DtxR family Mn-dependent transcriptional regulator
VNYTTSEENYIKTIFHLQNGQDPVTTNELADRLSTRAASVTDMMKKLKAKKIVNYQAYKGFRLTPDGKRIALDIIRRHRLWEYFLAEKLQFSWDEVHAVAEDLEHVSSKKLIDKLDEFLGFPRVDPHGDPIPDVNGKIEFTKTISLDHLPLNKIAEVNRVINQSAEMLELLQHKKISIGTKLEIKKKFSFDHSFELKIKQQTINITQDLAKNIFVKYEE